MTVTLLLIRPFQEGDEEALVSLWNMCKLTVPWNNPYKDIARKLKVQAELFLVGYLEDKLIASVMGGLRWAPRLDKLLSGTSGFSSEWLRKAAHGQC